MLRSTSKGLARVTRLVNGFLTETISSLFALSIAKLVAHALARGFCFLF